MLDREEFIQQSYSYIYHLSNYRDVNRQWACIRREDYVGYFNGSKPICVGYGESPELAFENVKALENE